MSDEPGSFWRSKSRETGCSAPEACRMLVASMLTERDAKLRAEILAEVDERMDRMVDRLAERVGKRVDLAIFGTDSPSEEDRSIVRESFRVYRSGRSYAVRGAVWLAGGLVLISLLRHVQEFVSWLVARIGA